MTEDKVNFQSIDDLLSEASDVELHPSEGEKHYLSKEERAKLEDLGNEAFVWDQIREALKTEEGANSPDVRRGVAGRLYSAYGSRPEVYFNCDTPWLKRDVEKGYKPLDARAKENLTSYVDSNLEDLLHGSKPKELGKIAVLMDRDYREKLKLLNDEEYDDMREALSFQHHPENIATLEDKQVAQFYAHYLDVSRQAFLMRFNAADKSTGKVGYSKEKMVEYIKSQYEDLDEDDQKAIKLSVSSKILNAYIKKQKDDYKDDHEDKEKEKDWIVQGI